MLRVNQSEVRRDGDPWHDVAMPLKSDDSRSSERSEVRADGTRSPSHDEALERLGDEILDRAISGYCYEHEICYHSLTSGKSDFVEISPHLTGLTDWFVLVLRRVHLLSLDCQEDSIFYVLNLRGRRS